ncbi:glycosyltransferase family 2 protein [Bradyrhizobium sp. CCGUVB4N]|uniref:glycosyltransferase family 2 protein n=1 Tax=Bradyrhizobium sp. CCGUVB4N TaxID=2949631 RepID=UPI0020B38229|nr:glycosyltransferase family 2 protein [Bradyrhizobium sp. CCGUVB4N]MCP3384043.1 glycosyltransferase family 2 protein [Bradyrhizobium sp. CCGUVB4N]
MEVITQEPSTARQVPAFDIHLYNPKRSRHALVIPVINEGERIRRQLRMIADVAPPVDVIVADGGSTDSSVNAEFVSALPVRAVLVKTGPGKLSAQLRMAYAWCLDEGYEGIITMDGNGKDGAEAIASMCAKLAEGYDYVQGSRYLPGGKAENTPLERTLANRCIHAPLLSFAGRHWYTDTTNGFRGYSRRYLLDSRVAPFRDVFQRYELLFYLTARAGQLGMKVCEVPVRRSYPLGEAPPTKIAGFKGKLAMLGELFDVVRGVYVP